MSEAMSSVEIEDVLSSIRRLVSEELRPGLRQVPSPKPEMPATAKPEDKLLLTPALRVVSDAAPPAAALPRLHLGAEPVARVVASSLERAVEGQGAEWESETGDPPLIVTEMEWGEDGWASPTADVISLVSRNAEPVAPWAQVDPEQEPAMSAQPESVTRPDPIAEPDRRWADRAEAEAVAELSHAEPVDAEMSFDEAVLRELVRDLILAELQGNLGERITRNIRKMVRAEIARAIAVHDID